MPVLAVFDFVVHPFLIFDFFLRQLFLKFVRQCFGRLDGSIRALRKVRIRNETDNFIESISQMVPRWSPEVPDGPQRSPKPITSCGRRAQAHSKVLHRALPNTTTTQTPLPRFYTSSFFNVSTRNLTCLMKA